MSCGLEKVNPKRLTRNQKTISKHNITPRSYHL